MILSRVRTLAAVAASAALLLASSACGGGSSGSSGSADADGNLSMWVRSGTAAQSQALVDAWNGSHPRKIDLTVIPNENYLQKVGVAAGSGELPDLLTSDGVFTPNYTRQGLFADLTDKVKATPFANSLTKAQLDIGTSEGKQYTVPHTVAVSALFQNDLVLKKAGVDPAAPVTSLQQLSDNAAKVAKLGKDYKGLYLTGNNGGSIGFTIFPSIWASGGEVLSKEGDKALVDSPEFVGVFDAYNKMFKAGSVAPASKEETGTTRDEVFAGGKVGYLLGSNSVLSNVPDSDKIKVGLKPYPGLTGGQSTYVGGDVIGISAKSTKANAAWDFLQWSLSDETQLEVVAKGGFLVSRTDLADNKYSKKDPRIVTLNALVDKGRIPYALKYGETFSDANGPWLVAARAALFGDGAQAALAGAKSSIDNSLAG